VLCTGGSAGRPRVSVFWAQKHGSCVGAWPTIPAAPYVSGGSCRPQAFGSRYGATASLRVVNGDFADTPQSRIVEEGDEWVVIDKPAGVPVPPTVDNLQETCLARVAAALDDTSCAPLRITHRLVRPFIPPSTSTLPRR